MLPRLGDKEVTAAFVNAMATSESMLSGGAPSSAPTDVTQPADQETSSPDVIDPFADPATQDPNAPVK